MLWLLMNTLCAYKQVNDMRVAIITENFLPKLDGVTRTLAKLLEYLQANGHQVLLLGPESGMQQYAGAELVGTSGVPFPFYPELKFNFFRPLFLRRLSEFSPDIIHLVDPVILGAAGLVAARLLNKPLVSSYHTNLAAYCSHFGFSPLTEPMWHYNRFIHNQCSLTFCPSPSTATMLHLQGFQHLRIWPRGVDTTFFRPQRRSAELRSSWLRACRPPIHQGTSEAREQPDNKLILLYVGRISWEKNLHLLVRAYQGLDHQYCHLVIVGDGPAYAEMRQLLADVPVTFTGYLSGDRLADAYASADIFAFPSRTETFGQAVLEAMASGLPVVGLLSEGVCDLVTNGLTGLLDAQQVHEEEQVASYRELLEELICDHSARQVMGQAALASAGKCSWPEAMQHLVQGYDEAIEHVHTPIAA
jgi:glycosyltransferase involved in cell wall biosynthesis